MQLQPPGRRGAVDTLVERHEGYAQRVHLIEERDQVPQSPPEAVQPPTRDDIDTPVSSVNYFGLLATIILAGSGATWTGVESMVMA